MSNIEPAPKYHPAVEEIMVTEGPDAGRIDDIEVAHDVAYREAATRERVEQEVERVQSIQGNKPERIRIGYDYPKTPDQIIDEEVHEEITAEVGLRAAKLASFDPKDPDVRYAVNTLLTSERNIYDGIVKIANTVQPAMSSYKTFKGRMSRDK